MTGGDRARWPTYPPAPDTRITRTETSQNPAPDRRAGIAAIVTAAGPDEARNCVPLGLTGTGITCDSVRLVKAADGWGRGSTSRMSHAR